MDDKVRAIRPSISMSPNKQAMLDHVASGFDAFVAANHPGGEPVAIAFAFVAIDGGANASWAVYGDAEDRASLYLTRAAQKLSAEVAAYDTE